MADKEPFATRNYWLGFGCSWLLLVFAWIIAWVCQGLFFYGAYAGPVVYVVVLALTYRLSQSAFKGLMTGLGIQIGLAILLVAACFGLVIFGRW